jgi:hypothetical protein
VLRKETMAGSLSTLATSKVFFPGSVRDSADLAAAV